MNKNILFKQFNLPKRANHYFHLIAKSKTGKLYYLHTSGVICVKYKNGKERILKSFMKKGQKTVKLIDKDVKIKSLVAKEIYNEYDPRKHSITFWDGNADNCDCYNLKICTKKELGQATGIKAGRNRKVLIDGVVYQSVRAGAKALFVSYQTLLDYLGGKVKNSVIPKNKKIAYYKDEKAK